VVFPPNYQRQAADKRLLDLAAGGILITKEIEKHARKDVIFYSVHPRTPSRIGKLPRFPTPVDAAKYVARNYTFTNWRAHFYTVSALWVVCLVLCLRPLFCTL
jgi:hypothetical protein